MNTHSVFSASSSHRWLRCPASLKEEAKIPSTSNVYAEEGTKAHKLAELFLTNSAIDIEKYDNEMINNVGIYHSYVTKINMSNDNLPLIECKVKYDNVVEGGFGTVDCICYNDNELHIIDLKYGKGVRVNCVNNSQLILYAIGALNYEPIKDFYKNKDLNSIKIFTHIVQPRINNITSTSYSYLDIQDKIKEYRDKAKLCLQDNPIFVKGEQQCKFCKYKYKCSTFLEKDKEQIENIIDIFKSADDKDLIENLPIEKIIYILDNEKEVITFINNVKDFVLQELQKGKVIGDYIISKSKSVRYWNDKAPDLLTNLIGEDAYQFKLKSITQIEKIIGKEKLKELDITTLTEGKDTVVKSK